MSEVQNNVNDTPVVYPSLNDFENDVFDAVYPVLADEVPSGNFRSEYVAEAESFPLVTMVRMDSIPDWSRQSTADAEDLTIDTYECHFYALSMEECKKLANLVGERMRQMNFRRITMRPVLNGNDTRISQIVARFEHRISTNGTMFR